MNIVNLTPHPIVLVTETENITIPSSGVSRVATSAGATVEVAGLPVPVAGATTFGQIEGLPDPVEGTFFIVSGIVASALVAAGKSRPDVLVPGTGPKDGALRDAEGRIVGVTRLVRATN